LQDPFGLGQKLVAMDGANLPGIHVTGLQKFRLALPRLPQLALRQLVAQLVIA